MSQSESNEDREYELLNEAILKAIVSSKDVRCVLEEFKSKKLIHSTAVLNLILSLEELSELIFKPETRGAYKLEPTQPSKQSSKPAKGKASTDKYNVDGRSLTPNEILFEAFCQESFDVKQWLKKNRINF
ncbi:MAG: hypothetical protein G3M78_09240 [Candidatus Nitrohelix vancouverensis]|uniref:Uncharacterized protein n=1 Tax=Candidatus Nitrohelix vancouverensis TaxID=2705534 RepID=A0A7T0G3S5_9BACT|nr:MAG: hypothetical protein G3M78_09240 [Candidatus Nitrohelix vancouverensis]